MNFNFEYLKHGKALCGKVFKRFVETFNFHNDFISNLKGDADLPAEGGHVNVDTTDPSHPVIRCKGCGGGSSSGGTSTTAPSPFEFTMVTPEPEEGEEEEPSETPAIVNNNFYWDGVLKSLSDFTPPATCTVYLCCTQAAPSSSGEAEWQFSIATSPAQAQSGGRVVNYKLYDLADNKVTMDYRTTFLELNSPHKVAKFTVEKPQADGVTAEIDASGTSASLSLAANGKSVLISTNALESGKSISFHTLTVKHSDGTSDEYDVLSDSDIEIDEAGAEELLTNVEIKLEGTKLYIEKTYTDKDGNERTEDSDGITLEEIDVVTGSSYGENYNFVNAKSKVTVLSSISGVDEDVFETTPHSEES